MKEFWTLHLWKEKLLLDLNNNILDVSDWERFIAEAEKRGCFEMAIDMRDRLEHYRMRGENAYQNSLKRENLRKIHGLPCQHDKLCTIQNKTRKKAPILGAERKGKK